VAHAACPFARGRGHGVRSVVLVNPPVSGLPTEALFVLPTSMREGGTLIIAGPDVRAASAPAARENAPDEKPASSARLPRAPAPSSPQAPVPFFAGASGGSASSFSVKILAALLALLVVTTPRGARVLRLAALLVQPPALAFGLKRPG
jgi:hypothetical protein